MRPSSPISEEFYSVEQVAERLGLHVRTVRTYIRDGRLKAVRIGKQYRIAREHLEALTGQATVDRGVETGTPGRHAEVSSIVQIEGIGVDAASRITTALMAAVNGRADDGEPLRIDTIYNPERARLKVILSGGVTTTASLLRFIDAYLQS
jgi:excisionase family DNA binding protein